MCCGRKDRTRQVGSKACATNQQELDSNQQNSQTLKMDEVSEPEMAAVHTLDQLGSAESLSVLQPQQKEHLHFSKAQSTEVAGLTPQVPSGPAPMIRQPFLRRRAFPTGTSLVRPHVLTHYSPGLRYMLTDRERKLLARVQAYGRGLALRAQLRRWWVAEWQACFYDKLQRLRRKLHICSLLIGMIQIKRQRYVRRKRRMARHAATRVETSVAAAAGKKSNEEARETYPPWFNAVAWASVIMWCVWCGFYTLVLGIFFGPVATLNWLFGSLGSMGYGGVVQDTFKIGLVVALQDQAEFLVDLYLEFMDFMPFAI